MSTSKKFSEKVVNAIPVTFTDAHTHTHMRVGNLHALSNIIS